MVQPVNTLTGKTKEVSRRGLRRRCPADALAYYLTIDIPRAAVTCVSCRCFGGQLFENNI